MKAEGPKSGQPRELASAPVVPHSAYDQCRSFAASYSTAAALRVIKNTQTSLVSVVRVFRTGLSLS